MLPVVSWRGKRAILFDIDGTLLDTREQVIRGLADSFKHFAGAEPTDEEIASTVGSPLTEQMKMYHSEPPSEIQIQEMVDYTIGRYQSYAHLVTPYEPSIEALRLAKTSGMKVAVVTSRNAVELEHFFDDFSAADLIDAAVCSSDVTHPKPHSESAELACHRLGVSPDEAIYIGDSLFDIHCAQSAGVTMIAVTYGMGRPETLRAANPDLIIETPHALLEWARAASETLCEPARN